MDDDVRENPYPGMLVIPKEMTFTADDGSDFEAALMKAMTEKMATVPLIMKADAATMGCIKWLPLAAHEGPRWRVSGHDE
jgi:hypothetical protein